MPTREQVEKALQTHFDAWNAKDRARWIANWHPDVVMQDPVGGPEKKGRAAVEASWDRSFQSGHDWRLEPVFMQVCLDQAAVHVRNHGTIDGRRFAMDSIELYWVGDDGRIVRVQTYFSPPEGQALDPYFMQQR
ncbi:MAG: nuclear transport factor 2 family protein [Myxococcota bacterium]